jgi:MoaA/NifB/PqqE/SkfB family radical SAM enzyme
MNTPSLPRSVCFRVTRFCNARCGFCLAPPDGSHPGFEVLTQRIDWLQARGVNGIHFCGGEPTIHPALPDLLHYTRTIGGSTKLTTNGIEMSKVLLNALRATRTEVKVSLHGDRDQHNAITGCDAFDRTTKNLRLLVAAGIPTSIQTTVVRDSEHVVEWVASFCLNAGIRKLSILPFIPRGDGSAQRETYELSDSHRRRLRDQVGATRRALSGQLDVRWLDFTAQPLHVVEADGRVILEGATESRDQLLCRIP